MGHEFETDNQITVDATPEQVWKAIATGPGIDSWFMGRNEVEPGEGGAVRMSLGDMFTGESTVTVWEPPTRFATRSAEEPDGGFHAFEYFVEGRGKGSTIVRLVHSGFIAGDDWEAEYDALRKGDPMYLRSLGEYLTHFAGRTGVPVTAWAAPQPSEAHAWQGILDGLGLTDPVREGDKATLTIDGTTIDGVVDSVLVPSFLGVRTADALYRFVGGGGAIGVGHHVFTANHDDTEEAWATWLSQRFA